MKLDKTRLQRTIETLIRYDELREQEDLVEINHSTHYVYGYTLLEIEEAITIYPTIKKDLKNDSLVYMKVNDRMDIIFVISD